MKDEENEHPEWANVITSFILTVSLSHFLFLYPNERVEQLLRPNVLRVDNRPIDHLDNGQSTLPSKVNLFASCEKERRSRGEGQEKKMQEEPVQ